MIVQLDMRETVLPAIGISHVILDEIHERDILSDFLLITIKRILKINPNLKLILMSATGDMRKLLSYFEK